MAEELIRNRREIMEIRREKKIEEGRRLGDGRKVMKGRMGLEEKLVYFSACCFAMIHYSESCRISSLRVSLSLQYSYLPNFLLLPTITVLIVCILEQFFMSYLQRNF